jgi:hypothetical protein
VPPGTAGTANDCVAALAEVNPNLSLSDTRHFKSDSLWNYELGVKTAWLDHRVTFNAAGFDIIWKDIQQQVSLALRFPVHFQRRCRGEQGWGNRTACPTCGASAAIKANACRAAGLL